MRSCIELHLAERQANGQAVQTIDICRNWLGKFASFCEERGLNWQQLVPADVEAFRQQLLWSPGLRSKSLLSPSTVDQGLRTLRTFLRWALHHGHIEQDPTAKWVLSRPKSLPRDELLTRAELDSVMDHPDCTRPVGLRNRAILGLMAELGFSARICLTLNVTDFDQAGSRIRGIQLAPRLHEFLCRYLHRARPALLADPNETALFLSKQGNRMDEQNVSLIPHRHSQGKARPRSLRRAWLTYREANLNRRLPEL